MSSNIILASTTDDGEQVSDATFYIDTEISPNGRFVAFLADTQTLDDPDAPTGYFLTPGYWYIKDTQTGSIVRIAAETFFPEDTFTFWPNIFENNYDVSMSNDYGIITYGSHVARFDLETGELGETYTLPKDPTSAFEPTAVTAGSVKYVFGWSRSINITEGELNNRYFEVDMINTENGAQSTASIPLKLYESRTIGEYTFNFLESAYIKDSSTSGRYVFVEIGLTTTRAKSGSFEAGTSTVDYGIYDTQSHNFTRLTDRNTKMTETFNVTSEFIDSDDYRNTSYEISDNGKFVVISTTFSDLVKNDTNDASDVFLLDLTTHKTTRISTGPKGQQLTEDSGGAAISADGRFVSYYSDWDLYVYDRVSGEHRQINVPIDGTEGFVSIRPTEITPDGKYIVFSSIYDNYVKGDTNTNREDVYRIENPFLPNAEGSPTYLSISNQSLAESAKVKALVARITGDDPGDGALTYTLSTNPGGYFKIVGDKLTLAKAIDYEKVQDVTINITAVDDDGHKLKRTFDIMVTDVVEDIVGDKKNNKLEGGIGSDNIKGLDGNDRLYGFAANDTLDGGTGADKLDGGVGNDTLTGGKDRDIFIFHADSGIDVITDFSAKQDQIDLTDIVSLVSFDTFIQQNVYDMGDYLSIYAGVQIRLDGITDISALTDKNVLI